MLYKIKMYINKLMIVVLLWFLIPFSDVCTVDISNLSKGACNYIFKIYGVDVENTLSKMNFYVDFSHNNIVYAYDITPQAVGVRPKATPKRTPKSERDNVFPNTHSKSSGKSKDLSVWEMILIAVLAPLFILNLISGTKQLGVDNIRWEVCKELKKLKKLLMKLNKYSDKDSDENTRNLNNDAESLRNEFARIETITDLYIKKTDFYRLHSTLKRLNEQIYSKVEKLKKQKS